MAGLLDFMQSDDARLGIGLLAAAGPSMMGVGERLQSVMSGMDAHKFNKMRMGLLQSQIDENTAQIEARKAATAKSAEGMKFLSGLLGPGTASYAPGQLGSGTFGALPSSDPMAPAARAGGLANATPEQIAMAKIYGHDLTEPWKVAKQGFELKAGNYRVDPSTGRREYIPNPVDGRTIDASGRVTMMPGAIDALTATTLATEAPKALLGAAGRVNLRKNADGTESPVSELSENPTLQGVLGNLLGQRAPVAAPAVGVPSDRPVIDPASQKAADAESIRMIQSELQNPRLPPDQRAGLERELSRLTASQSQSGFPTPTLFRGAGYGMTNTQTAAAAGEKARAEAEGRAAGERQANREKRKDSANDMLSNIERARNLLQMDPTGSLLGAGVDRVMNAAGVSTNGSRNAAALETISGWLVNNVPRMEGPQSNFDLTNYQTMSGKVGDRTLPVAERLAALEEVDRIQKKYAGLNPDAPSGQKTNLVAELPKTAAKGTRARDTSTGKVMVFNGLSWVAEK